MKTKLKQASLIWVICMLGCNSPKRVILDQNDTGRSSTALYKVCRIDSLNSYYLIYARKQDTLYKIVSKKQVVVGLKKIRVNNEYPFSLISLWHTKVIVHGYDVPPANASNLNCLTFDDDTSICLERDSINDLFSVNNVKGLYFITNK